LLLHFPRFAVTIASKDILETLMYSAYGENGIIFLHVFSSIKASTSILKSFNCLATMVFKVVIALEQFAEPAALEFKNLFPVNAKGEVLFLSVLSKRDIWNFTPTTFNFKSVFLWEIIFFFPEVTPSNSAKTLVELLSQ
jgi:hypothetical protein